MNAKKIAAIFLCGVLAFSAGCGFWNTGDSMENRELRVGMLKNFNVSEKEYAAIIKQESAEKGGIPSTQFLSITSYNTLSALLMGLDAGTIDVASTYQSVANYLMARSPHYTQTDFIKAGMMDAFCCALRKENAELLQSMNQAIADMEEEGTLDRLVKEYITDIKNGQDPPPVATPKFPGAETIRVAVTGDLPPIDMILPDGSPAGFNTAVLSEIGRRIEKNIEIIRVDSGARITALTSGQVDAVFWAVVPAEPLTARPPEISPSLDISTTRPYYKDEIVHLKLKYTHKR